MKIHLSVIGAAVIIVLSVSCKKSDSVSNPVLEGKIVYYNEFGAAMLDFTESDMTKAGFTLGDIVSISVDHKEIVMPYYDGYYTRNGEYLCVAYPTYPGICFTANNTGLPEEFTGLENHPVVVTMKEKGGSLDVQEALSMKYTNVREDYTDFSDAQFANARETVIGTRKLYRSSSPFCDDIGRANYVSAFLEEENVRSVLNLADNEEMILSYNLPSYSKTLWESGNVILCPLKADPTADAYNDKLIEALIELPSHPAPASSSKMRRAAIFLTRWSMSSCSSSWPTPSRISSPSPMADLTLPPIVTEAELTRWMTARMLLGEFLCGIPRGDGRQ